MGLTGLLLLILLGMNLPILAQNEVDISDLLEGLESESIGQTDFWQILQDLQDHPLNVNTATAQELLRIPFISESVAREMVRYRRENGKFADAAALLAVSGVTDELLAAIVPYIRFRNERQLPVVDYRTQTGGFLHERRGDVEGQYTGRWQLYQRLRWRPTPDVLATAIWEKDAGEANWSDFGAFSLGYDWRKARSYLIFGDYNIETGQRLVFSGAYGTPLIANSFLPYRNAMFRFRPKSAVDENAFLRGAMWAYAPTETLNLLLFYSNHNLDANIDGETVRSIYNSGLHRTETELAKRDLLGEKALGGVMQVQFKQWIAGVQASRFDYSIAVERPFTRPRDGFNYLSGFWQAGGDLLQSGGEIALLNGKFPAIQQSVLLHLPDSRWSYGAAVYYFHPEYWANHGRALGKISESPENGVGISMNASLKLAEQSRLAAYAWLNRDARDVEEFPQLKQVQQILFTQRIAKSELLLRYTRRSGERSGENSSGIRIPIAIRSHTWRVQLRSKISPKVQLTQRTEISKGATVFGAARDYGFALYSDVSYRPTKYFTIQTRWTVFDVPDFEYRLYEFETDLPGSFRNILLNDRGYKWFVLAGYEVWGSWRFSVKYQEMVYPDLETLSSGLDEILGNRKRILRLQLQVTY